MPFILVRRAVHSWTFCIPDAFLISDFGLAGRGLNDAPGKADTMRVTAMLELARRLLVHEAGEGQDQESSMGAAERVLDKLRLHLSKRIGQEGFRTLLARALTLTTARFPQLGAIRVGTDGSLVGLPVVAGSGSQETLDNIETLGSITQEDFVEGAIALVSQLLELLATFIGGDITLRILTAVWPETTQVDALSRR